jgi:hypothetical protein
MQQGLEQKGIRPVARLRGSRRGEHEALEAGLRAAAKRHLVGLIGRSFGAPELEGSDTAPGRLGPGRLDGVGDSHRRACGGAVGGAARVDGTISGLWLGRSRGSTKEHVLCVHGLGHAGNLRGGFSHDRFALAFVVASLLLWALDLGPFYAAPDQGNPQAGGM